MEINAAINAVTAQAKGVQVNQENVGRAQIQIQETVQEVVMPPAVQTQDAAANATPTPVQNIAEVLELLGFMPTRENIDIVARLISVNLPATKENILRLNQAQKLAGDQKIALFLVENGIRISPKNAEALKALAGGEVKLLQGLEEIARTVENLPNETLREELIQIFTVDAAESLPAPEIKVMANLGAAPEGLTRQNSTENASLPETVVQPQETLHQSEPAEGNAGIVKTYPRPAEPVATNSEAFQTETVGNTAASRPEQAEPPSPAPMRLSNAVQTENAKNENITSAAERNRTAAPDFVAEKENIIRNASLSEKTTTDRSAKMKTDKTGIIGAAVEKPSTKAEKSSFLDKLISKYSVKPESDKPEDLSVRLNKLREDMARAAGRLPKQGEEGQIFAKLDRITKSIELFNEIKKVYYLQFPVTVENREANAELYVFRDKREKSEKPGSSQSALLSLDFANLGHFEAYIQKNGKSVLCRFKAGEEAAALISGEIARLSEMLAEKGFNLDGYTFSKLSEPFTILDAGPPAANGAFDAAGLYRVDIKA